MKFIKQHLKWHQMSCILPLVWTKFIRFSLFKTVLAICWYNNYFFLKLNSTHIYCIAKFFGSCCIGDTGSTTQHMQWILYYKRKYKLNKYLICQAMQTILCSEVASSITDRYQQTQEEKNHIFEWNDIAKF